MKNLSSAINNLTETGMELELEVQNVYDSESENELEIRRHYKNHPSHLVLHKTQGATQRQAKRSGQSFQSVKDYLRRLYPQNTDIQIKISKDQKGPFVSKITVNGPHRKFFSSKKDTSYWRSLERTYKAIARQLQKAKSNHQRRVRKLAFLE
jgi:ribosome-associated translation inhibitor RaiA